MAHQLNGENPAGYKTPNNRNYGEVLRKNRVHGSIVDTRCEHVVNNSDSGRRWCSDGFVNLIDVEEFIDGYSIVAFVGCIVGFRLDHKIPNIDVKSDLNTPANLLNSIIIFGIDFILRRRHWYERRCSEPIVVYGLSQSIRASVHRPDLVWPLIR